MLTSNHPLKILSDVPVQKLSRLGPRKRGLPQTGPRPQRGGLLLARAGITVPVCWPTVLCLASVISVASVVKSSFGCDRQTR
jgi:hypothetical protein